MRNQQRFRGDESSSSSSSSSSSLAGDKKNHERGGSSSNRRNQAHFAVWMVSCCIQLLLLMSSCCCCCSGFVVLRPTPPSSSSARRNQRLTTIPPPSSRPASSSSLIVVSWPSSTTSSTSSSTTTALFGIPKMFRWLTDQYPDILNRQLEKEGLSADLKVDAFYLDMNGIIHPCTHGNNNDAGGGEFIVLDETAMFKKIFLYVDRLYKLVRPSQVLYLAVDGVAPRAKMNQQRSRRFRSAAEAEMAMADAVAQQQAKTLLAANQPLARRRDDVAAAASMLPAEFQGGGKRFDSNCITPGTDFMLKLSLAMQKWVEFKMQTDDFWKYHGALNVIVSGPDVPGEGEHKVMDFLRQQQQKHQQRHKNGQAEHANSNNDDDDDDDGSLYQPNYTHVLYGLDADLIMLGLVTHEPNFLLLREKMSVVMAGRGRNNNNNRGRGGGGRGGGRQSSSNNKKKDMLDYNENDFEVLELSGLRQMLALQFQKFLTNNNKTNNKSSSNKEAFDLTRIVDDFVFMCMLVGNDFLPHAPHLEIDAGAISLMMSNYMDLLGDSWGGGYLTHKERIHPQRLEEFIYCLAAYEEEHFKRRGYEENEPGWKLSAENEEEVDDFYGTFYSGEPTPACAVPANVRKPITGQGRFDGTAMDKDEPAPEERPMEPSGNRSFRRKHPDSLSRSYRDFYYDVKMGWKPNDRSRTLYRRRTHVRDYLEGLHWCLNYYHNGCPSWNWYFPYLYSPLCTDMVNLHEFYSDPDEHGYCSMKFDQGEPFPSLAQLLSVLPPQSADLLPNALAELMLHTSSPLKSFYPPDFTTDPNGKRQSWEAVVEIPFINADVLLETVQQILNADAQGKELLSNAERRRNLPGRDHVFRPNREDAADQEQAHKRAAAAAAATTATAAATTSPAAKRRRATAPKQQ